MKTRLIALAFVLAVIGGTVAATVLTGSPAHADGDGNGGGGR